MLTKFETKSNRVKGLAFHPKRPWILASLHSGAIQLWDYRIGTLIDRFVDHDGPVRGVEFHSSQPIFVSGGDDYKVKIWSYKTRRCQFTLTGHLDYVRTVRFHPEKPWIVSASDDQTVRIWNWQSRSCISVLTGHNHYVMCASFHPKEDLVVSASLDQTVRVWDISSLCKRSVAPGGEESSMNSDLFGSGDAVVKYVLEGHERGVNWASFHPTLPLIVSGADDRLIKLWRTNESKAWEVDSLRGHMNNVSCVIFSGRQDVIVSNSEDRTIRIWDMSRRVALQTFRREHERFWILAAHPEINLLAAGHDSGMLVFKLERERPPYAVHGTNLFYVGLRSGVTALRCYDVTSGQTNMLQVIPKPAGGATKPPIMRSMSFNPAENAILINTDEEGGTYKFYQLPSGNPATLTSRGEVPESFAGQGATAVFIARNRFAVWNRFTSTIQIHNLQNEITKRCPPPDSSVSGLFYAGTGLLLCRCDEKVILFDVQQRTAVSELQAAGVKYVVWNSASTLVALLSKHNVVVADAKLGNAATVHETIRVKSAAWTDNGVLIYTTLNHIKYCLPGGDSGIVKTLDQPVYIFAVVGETVHALDRDGKALTIPIDPSEFTFKRALALRKYETMRMLIKSKKLCGQAIIAYLRSKGHPEVALLFVEDDRERFEVALECGNIEVALAAAQRLGDSDILGRLGTEAFRQGNLEIAEKCCQQTKAYERLSFLYAVAGDTEKLWKMLKLAEMRGDVMSRYSNTLYLGSATARSKVLEDSGHLSLAHVCAAAHGLQEDAAKLREKLGEKAITPEAGELMMPLTPILRQRNWPLLEVSSGGFGGAAAAEALTAATSSTGGGIGAAAAAAAAAGDDEEEDADADAWGGDDLDLGGGDEAATPRDGGDDEDGGWELEDLDLPDLPKEAATASGGPYAPPPPGVPVTQRWVNKAKLPAEYAAAGDFSTAARMLELQVGAASVSPLKPSLLALQCSSTAYCGGLPGLPPMTVGVDSTWEKTAPPPPASADAVGVPATPFKLAALEESLKDAYKLFTNGKFADALAAFQTMLEMIPLTVVDTRRQADEVKELLAICREYHTGLRCEIERRKLPADSIRMAELAAYLTHQKLEAVHLKLALNAAMTVCYKKKLKATAAILAHRLLELEPNEKVLAACEADPVDAEKIAYDPRNPFDLCPVSLVPIYRGTHFVECPYSSAKCSPEHEGKLSPVGGIAQIGKSASGLTVSHTQLRP